MGKTTKAAAPAAPAKSAAPSRNTKGSASPATMTVREAAEALGVGLNQAYGAADRGEIPSIRIGGRILIPRSALARLLEGA